MLRSEGGARRNGISALVRRDMRELASPSLFLPCEDTARRQPSMNQEAGLHQTLNLPEP